jgi:hypothetical protein
VDELHGAGEKRRTSAFERDAVRGVERLATEARLGRAPRPEDLDPLDWELLVLWQGREAEHEAAARQSLHELNANVTLLLNALTVKQ